jgi:hypothetical protein
MYRKLGMDAPLLRRSADALAKALEGGRVRTRGELRQALEQAGIPTQAELRLVYFLMNAELEGLICSGPRQGRQFTYALLAERAPQARLLDRGEALAELARRFFTSRGPATSRDFAKWSGLTLADARAGLEASRASLEQVEVDGQAYWHAPGPPLERPTAPRVWLLSIYDELISGYQDRSAIVSPAFGEELLAMGNALTSIVVLDGQIVGAWRRSVRKNEVMVETNLFHPPGAAERRALESAAAHYGEFLGLAARVVDWR